MRTTNPKAPARPAFTLVELLVVIGIIALLVSIVLPTLAPVRPKIDRRGRLTLRRPRFESRDRPGATRFIDRENVGNREIREKGGL